MNIQLIADRLAKINGDIFQELCDCFLALRNSNYTAFVRSGSVATKQKSKKGTPDSFLLLPNGRYLFLEATTIQDRLFEKLKGDLRKCMNEAKTGIPDSKIQEIILCYNTDLATHEVEELSSLVESFKTHTVVSFYGLSRLSSEIALHHRNLARDYLGLSLDSGQIVSLEQFVKSYNNSAQRIATPLDNQFLHREEELKSAVTALHSTDLIILTGPPGVGKTRLALESIKEFAANNLEYNAYAISNKNVDIAEDLQKYANEESNSVVFIDDVNRFDRFTQVIAFYAENNTNRLKLVLTVRDYALSDINNELLSFHYELIHVDKLKDEELLGIIHADPFKITNNQYTEKIIEIADGNPRLAIMAGLLAVKEQKIESLNNVSDLFDSYFNSFINDKDAFQNQEILKVLGIVSFYYTIPYNDREVMDEICKSFKLDSLTFYNALNDLEKLELIELRFEHAKISEQNISTYFFYKVFIKDRLLSFQTLLTYYFFSFQSRFRDTIVPAIRMFEYKNVMEGVVNELRTFWNLVKVRPEKEILEYLDHFWFYLRTESLDYFVHQINSYPEPTNPEFIFTYETNDYVHDRDQYIQLFGEFLRVGFDISEVLELSFAYVKKKPIFLPQLVRELDENFSIDYEDFYSGFYRHERLIEFCSKEIDRGNWIISKTFLAISKQLLQFQFQQYRPARGNAIRMYRYPLQLSGQSEDLRKNIWDLIESLYISFPNEVFDVLMSHGGPSIDFQKEIFEYDLQFVSNIINDHLDAHNYKHCRYVQELIRWARKEGVSEPEFNQWIRDFSCRKYQWLLKVDWDKLRGKEDYEFEDWNEFAKLKEKDIRQSFQFNDLASFREFLEFLEELKEWKTFYNKQNIDKTLTVVIDDSFKRDINLGFKFLNELICTEALKDITPFDLITRSAGRSDLYEEFWNFIEISKTPLLWKLTFLGSLPENLISETYLERLYQTYDEIHDSYYLSLDPLRKFQKIDPNVLENLLSKVLNKIENEGLKISLGYHFFTELSPLIQDVSILKKVYLNQQNRDSHFHYDHDGKELSILIKRDPSFFLEYLQSIFDSAKGHFVSYRDHQELCVVWELENCYQILDEVLVIVIKRDPFTGIGNHFMNCFFKNIPMHKDRALEYLLSLIERYHMDSRKMNIVFDVIRNSFNDLFNNAFEKFISHNQDVEVFRKINWTSSGTVIHHGHANFGDVNAAKWRKLLNLLKSNDLGIKIIPIKSFVENQILYEVEHGNMERKRDFISKL